MHAWPSLSELGANEHGMHAKIPMQVKIYMYIYTHTQEKLGELMGSIRKRMIFVERGRGRGGNSTRERFRIAGWPPKRGAWF
jgi:hypothetical protein